MHQHSAASLQAYLQANTTDLHGMTLAAFGRWLQQRISDSSRRESFRTRCQIRDIRRRERRRIRSRVQRLDQVRSEWHSSPDSAEYDRLESAADSLSQAVAGLSEAVRRRDADPEKLRRYERRLEDSRRQLDQLRSRSPLFRRLRRAESSLERLRQQLGLDELEESLRQHSRQRGHAASRSGRHFETTAEAAVQRFLVPGLSQGNDRIIVLQGATLGCARGEFDQLIVRVISAEDPVEVLALVEAKRNINDIPHGFRLRQENLAWFVNDRSGFEADAYRTDYFPAGSFDRAVTEIHDGVPLRFDRTSFRRFAQRDPVGHRISGLCFVVEDRPLSGLMSQELSRLMHHVSTNEDIRIDDTWTLRIGRRKLQLLRDRLLENIAPLQAADILAFYAERDVTAREILFA